MQYLHSGISEERSNISFSDPDINQFLLPNLYEQFACSSLSKCGYILHLPYNYLGILHNSKQWKLTKN